MYLDQVLSDLEGEEYTCWTFNIPACALDAPHRRERIFVVAYSERSKHQQEKRRGNEKTQRISKVNRPEHSTPRKSSGTSNVAYSSGKRLEGTKRRASEGERFTIKNRMVSNSNGKHSQEQLRGNQLEETTGEGSSGWSSSGDGGFWQIESGVGRVANGVPKRVDRLRALGNAVVPQVAEFIGKQIMETQW